MSNDRYANIRKALAMGPTPGPWEPSYDKGSTRDIITQKEKYPICMVRGIAYVGQSQYLANGHFIAACDPDTIRELLAERDELAKDAARYRLLRKGAVDDVAVVRGLGAMDYGMSAVAYTYSEEIDGDDLDATIDAAMEKEANND
jgi:hypothetical protein